MKKYIAALFFIPIVAFSAETKGLHLKGKVIALYDNSVKINVTSQICKGTREFILSPKVDRKMFKEGRTVLFIINSDSCKGKKSLTIVGIAERLRIKR